MSVQLLTKAEVSQLPKGSLVAGWKVDSFSPKGRPDDYLIAVETGSFAPVSLLSERAGPGVHVPQGAGIDIWEHEKFALIFRGEGKLFTKSTANRKIIPWIQSWRKG